MDILSGFGSVDSSDSIDKYIKNLSIVENLTKSKKSNLTKSKKSILAKYKISNLPKTNLLKVNFFETDFLTFKTKKAFIYL